MQRKLAVPPLKEEVSIPYVPYHLDSLYRNNQAIKDQPKCLLYFDESKDCHLNTKPNLTKLGPNFV